MGHWPKQGLVQLSQGKALKQVWELDIAFSTSPQQTAAEQQVNVMHV